jgi:hypothetical protein
VENTVHRGLAFGMRPALKLAAMCIILVIQQRSKEAEMDFIRAIEARDWMIAAVAFFAGAIIF